MYLCSELHICYLKIKNLHFILLLSSNKSSVLWNFLISHQMSQKDCTKIFPEQKPTVCIIFVFIVREIYLYIVHHPPGRGYYINKTFLQNAAINHKLKQYVLLFFPFFYTGFVLYINIYRSWYIFFYIAENETVYQLFSTNNFFDWKQRYKSSPLLLLRRCQLLL